MRSIRRAAQGERRSAFLDFTLHPPITLPPTRESQRKETVVFVHALWLHGLSLLLQARRIERCGFTADCSFSYASVTGSIADHGRGLARHIASLEAPRIHLVGHSMGTLVILKMLAQHPDSRIGRAVLLGPPFHGSIAGRTLGQFAPGRWMLGQSYALWAQRERVPPPRDVEVGVIAGTRPVGAGVVLGVLKTPHDGVVTVDETRIPGICDHISLNVSHSEMIFAASVAQQVAAFLQRGRFDRARSRPSKDGA